MDSLYEDGKINIYPMKNTIDLKKSLGKKMKKIAKKTEKAILSIAHKMIKGTAPNASSKQ